MSESSAVEDGRSLDRQALQSVRALLAGDHSRDSQAQSDIGQDFKAATSDASAERDAARDGAAPSSEQLVASASPSQGVSTEGKQNQQAAWRSSSRIAKQKGARLQKGSGPEESNSAQGAEWQLSSLSQKALRTSKSSSLVSLLPVLTICFAVQFIYIDVHHPTLSDSGLKPVGCADCAGAWLQHQCQS